MKTCLITGSSGFVGQHLKNELIAQGYQVFEFDIKRGCNLLDYEHVRNDLDLFRPDEIYHLAAQAYVPESVTNPARTMQVNVIGTINLLEAVKNLGIETKILLACTSEEYGLVKGTEIPINEGNPLRPQSPYAISKVTVDMLGDWYTKQHGLHIVRTRAFNHTGPGRGEMYVESSFAKQIATIEASGQPGTIYHGNLDAVRDFTDVRDMVRAYILAVTAPVGYYNIGSGKGIAIKDLLNYLMSLIQTPIRLEESKSRMRKTEVPVLVCDASRFKMITGWEPQIPFEQTMQNLLDYWREQIK